MILKITNDFNMILNENDYQAFVASIDLLSLHCPVCGVVGLFILYGHYKRFVIIVRLKYLFNVSNVLNVDPLTLCFQLILFLMLISYSNKHYICPPIHYTSYFLFTSLETPLMLSRYAFSTGVKVISSTISFQTLVIYRKSLNHIFF